MAPIVPHTGRVNVSAQTTSAFSEGLKEYRLATLPHEQALAIKRGLGAKDALARGVSSTQYPG